MEFSDYLEQKYIDEMHPLDDEMADGFGEWLAEQDTFDLIKWAEEWHIEQTDTIINNICGRLKYELTEEDWTEWNNDGWKDLMFEKIDAVCDENFIVDNSIKEQ